MMQTQEFLSVVGNACNIWQEFVQDPQSGYDPSLCFLPVRDKDVTKSKLDAHRTESVRIQLLATKFLKFCARFARKTSLGAVVLHELKYLRVPKQRGGETAACWLWSEGDGRPSVHIDPWLVQSRAPDRLHQENIYTRLLLHEAGHLVLQWDRLVTTAGKEAVACSPHDERCAWWFAETILLLAIGELAFYRRSQDEHDSAWKYG